MKLFVIVIFVVARASVEGKTQWFPGFSLDTALKEITGHSTGLLVKAANGTKIATDTAHSAIELMNEGIDSIANKIRNGSDKVIDKALSTFPGSTSTGTGSLDATRTALPGSNISARGNTDAGAVVDFTVPTSNISPPTGTMETNSAAVAMKAVNKALTEMGASMVKESVHSSVAEYLIALKVTSIVFDIVSNAAQAGKLNTTSTIECLSDRISAEIPATLGIKENDNGVIGNLKSKIYKSLKETLKNYSGEDEKTLITRIVTVVVNVICNIFAVPTTANQSSSSSTDSSASFAEKTSSTSTSSGGSFSLNM